MRVLPAIWNRMLSLRYPQENRIFRGGHGACGNEDGFSYTARRPPRKPVAQARAPVSCPET